MHESAYVLPPKMLRFELTIQLSGMSSIALPFCFSPRQISLRKKRLYGGAARTVHLFNLDNLPDSIVLLRCCLVRCRVAELVPHFTLYALRIALCMLSLCLAQQHKCLCLGLEPVPLSSTTATVQMSGFLLLFWVPNCIQYEMNVKAVIHDAVVLGLLLS